MTQPSSILNAQGQRLDPIVDDAGTIRLKKAVGVKTPAGLANESAWQGVATHIDGATFAASDGVVLLAGYDSATPLVRKVLVDTTGRLLVDVQARRLALSQTPTVSSGAVYAAKDVVGTLLTFATAARTGILSGVLESVAILDKGQQMAALDLVLFNSTVTPASDNASFSPTDADAAKVIAVIPILTTDYHDFFTNSVAVVKPSQAYVLTGTSLFGVLVSRGTPTYTSTTDLVVALTVKTD